MLELVGKKLSHCDDAYRDFARTLFRRAFTALVHQFELCLLLENFKQHTVLTGVDTPDKTTSYDHVLRSQPY